MHRLLHHAQTDIGKQRTNNEDTYVHIASPDNRHVLIGAIDGMGGYEGGEVAAALYRQSLERSFNDTLLQGFSPTTAANLEDLRQWAIAGNNSIVDEAAAQPERPQMACVATIALIDVAAEQLYYAHVGDSRAYLFRRGELIKLTHDHSPVGRLEDSGAILEPEAMRHPRRNVVDRSLGQVRLSSADMEHVEVGSHSFYAGDTVLLCSDGLTDLVDRATLAAILSQEQPLEVLTQQLIDQANALGGKDNITVALAKFLPEAPVTPAAGEASLLVEEVIIATSANKKRAAKRTQGRTKTTPPQASVEALPPQEEEGAVSERRSVLYVVLMAVCLLLGLALGTLYGQQVLAWIAPTTPAEQMVMTGKPAEGQPLPADSVEADSLYADSVLIAVHEKAEYDSLKRAARTATPPAPQR